MKWAVMIIILGLFINYVSGDYILTAKNFSIKEKNGYHIIKMDGFNTYNSPGNPILPYKIYDIIVPPYCN